jgi:hypothetical protein
MPQATRLARLLRRDAAREVSPPLSPGPRAARCRDHAHEPPGHRAADGHRDPVDAGRPQPQPHAVAAVAHRQRPPRHAGVSTAARARRAPSPSARDHGAYSPRTAKDGPAATRRDSGTSVSRGEHPHAEQRRDDVLLRVDRADGAAVGQHELRPPDAVAVGVRAGERRPSRAGGLVLDGHRSAAAHAPVARRTQPDSTRGRVGRSVVPESARRAIVPTGVVWRAARWRSSGSCA